MSAFEVLSLRSVGDLTGADITANDKVNLPVIISQAIHRGRRYWLLTEYSVHPLSYLRWLVSLAMSELMCLWVLEADHVTISPHSYFLSLHGASSLRLLLLRQDWQVSVSIPS